MTDPVNRLAGLAVLAVFAALPTVGLVAGPSYAALIFGLAIVHLMADIATRRRPPHIDRAMAVLAAAFAAWCWATVLWSIDPARTGAAALQMTAILAGCLIFLTLPPPAGPMLDRLFRVLFVATLLGGAVFLIDRALGYPLQSMLMGRSQAYPAAKYSRGIDHLVLIAWPQLGYFAWRRDWRRVVVLAAMVVVIEAVGWSLAGKVGLGAGLLVLALGALLPRAAYWLLVGGTAAFVAGLPFGLGLLAEHRFTVAPYLKESGLHRMEIWDFMTRRVLDSPVLGWGFGVAGHLPITAADRSDYAVLRDAAIYPHNQWLGIWVESGVVGAAIALAFALLVLLRIRSLTVATRPCGYAVFASAMAIACVNFEVKTDSWWAAMIASAWLLTALDARIAIAPTSMTRS